MGKNQRNSHEITLLLASGKETNNHDEACELHVEVNEGDYNLLKCLVKAGVEDRLVKVN